jgi:hypothetical protein
MQRAEAPSTRERMHAHTRTHARTQRRGKRKGGRGRGREGGREGGRGPYLLMCQVISSNRNNVFYEKAKRV